MPITNTLAVASARGFGYGTEDAFGEQAYLSPGTYTFYVPAGVTSLSMVSIGAGAGGGRAGDYTNYDSLPFIFNTPSPGSGSASYRAGGGGGLAYSNSVSVTPGQALTIVVGDGGSALGTNANPADGGDSYVQTSGGTKLVHAGGGKGAGSGSIGGAPIVGSGGSGGTGGNWSFSLSESTFRGGGGGGAGGYSGNGGNGGNSASDGSAGAGGGGGGGGGSGTASYLAGGGTYYQYVFTAGAAGGGTGLYGEGSSGAGGAKMVANGTSNYSPAEGGGGGSSGNDGSDCGPGTSGSIGASNTNGGPGFGTCGGGAGNGGMRVKEDATTSVLYDWFSSANGTGATGGVRIIWTTNPSVTRAFPSTNVGRL